MFLKISEGDIFTTKENCATSGPRCAVLPDGRIVCTFMINSKSGANDFVPMITYADKNLNFGKSVAIWPQIIGKESVFGSVRKGEDGKYYIAGKIFHIEYKGEAFWSDEAMGMKENELFFSVSDNGENFSKPQTIKLPYYASAEQPGGMYVDKGGELYIVYSPYPTIKKKQPVDSKCMVLLKSTDGGKIFNSKKFAAIDGDSQYAESWITRLSDKRLVVSTWQTASDNSSQYFISNNNGDSFSGPYFQPFKGQSTGICATDDGELLIAYNQRKYGTIGVWLAMEKFDKDGDFTLIENEPVWQADNETQNNESTNFENWTDFSFGEPSVVILPDKTILITLWYQKGDVKGIKYIQVKKV